MYQKTTVVGYLGNDPQMRNMPDGSAVTNFNLATSRTYNDSRTNQKVKETSWFKVSVFGRRAESANTYLQKGSRVLIEGRLKVDPETGGPKLWTRQDGSVGASFEITVTELTFLNSREEGEALSAGSGGTPSPAAAPAAGSTGGGKPVEEDEIPF